MLFIPVHLFHMGQFRHNIPLIPPPPNRAEWAQSHERPYTLVAVEEVDPTFWLPPGNYVAATTSHTFNEQPARITHARLDRFITQAKAILSRDYSTIERGKAIDAQVQLEHVCERVKTEAKIPESDHVFFDPGDNRFWVYPEAKADN